MTSRKVKKELEKFKAFKKNFKFEMKELETKKDESIFVDGVCIREGKDGEWVGETETIINVGYKIHGAISKALSNLFHYEFKFKGLKVNSIESVFQALKFDDKKSQKAMAVYFGLDSNNVKAASNYDWKKLQKFCYMGKIMSRESSEYEDFVDELYISAIQNPLFRNALKNVGDKYILHAMGEPDKTKTVFSRFEFEYELNAIKTFVQGEN